MSGTLELTKKWDQTGLLDQLENKAKAAQSLEESYKFLIDLDFSDEVQRNLEWNSGLVLPALSRVYCQKEGNSKVDGEEFAQTFLEMSEEHNYRETAEDMDTYHQVDAEAEICQMFVEYYLQNHVDQ